MMQHLLSSLSVSGRPVHRLRENCSIRPLQSSTCFEHYMLIIRRLNCIDAASGIVTFSVRPVHRLRGNCSIRPLQYCTCFEHYMLIIRRLNCVDATSGIVTLSKLPSSTQVESDDTRCCINTIQPPDDEHVMLEICRGL